MYPITECTIYIIHIHTAIGPYVFQVMLKNCRCRYSAIQSSMTKMGFMKMILSVSNIQPYSLNYIYKYTYIYTFSIALLYRASQSLDHVTYVTYACAFIYASLSVL